VNYLGQWQGVGFAADYNIGAALNLPLGTRYTNPAGTEQDRYSYIANRSVPDNFLVVRYGGSYTKALGDWQLRGALSGQFTRDGLIPGEQFGLAGSSAVRGFNERAFATDRGHVVNLEGYTPELGAGFGLPGNLRALAFFDFARGENRKLAALSTSPVAVGIASAGLGLRYSKDKDLSLKLDVAMVTQPGPVGTESRGDVRGHLNLSIGF
jgi:hemolysin activation/secretion protein